MLRERQLGDNTGGPSIISTAFSPTGLASEGFAIGEGISVFVRASSGALGLSRLPSAHLEFPPIGGQVQSSWATPPPRTDYKQVTPGSRAGCGQPLLGLRAEWAGRAGYLRTCAVPASAAAAASFRSIVFHFPVRPRAQTDAFRRTFAQNRAFFPSAFLAGKA